MNREKSPRRDPSMRPLFRGVMNPRRPGRRYAKCNSCSADGLTNVYDKLRNPLSLDRGRPETLEFSSIVPARNCIIPSPSFNDSPNDQTSNNRIDCVAKCGQQNARHDATCDANETSSRAKGTRRHRFYVPRDLRTRRPAIVEGIAVGKNQIPRERIALVTRVSLSSSSRVLSRARSQIRSRAREERPARDSIEANARGDPFFPGPYLAS